MIKLYFLQKKLCCTFFTKLTTVGGGGGTNEGYSTPFMYELTLLYVAPVLAKQECLEATSFRTDFKPGLFDVN